MVGWDTDEFPTNIYDTTFAMYELLENGGIEPGGINFDAKVRRTSFEQNDLLLAHIAGMDTFARGLKAAAKIKEEKFMQEIIDDRYADFNTTLGKNILADNETLETLSKYALQNKEPQLKSGNIEYYKSILNDYLV